MSYDMEDEACKPYDETKGMCHRHPFQTTPCAECADEKDQRAKREAKETHRVREAKHARPMRVQQPRMRGGRG